MSYVRRASSIGSVYHASVIRGCVPVSASSSLIYHSGFSNTITWQRRVTTTAIARRSCRTRENCMHAEQIIIFYIFYFLLYVFGIVFNGIIQNKLLFTPTIFFYIIIHDKCIK